MKLFTLLILALFMTACSRTQTSTVGTLVSVNSISGKACDFGTITIQPATVGGELLNYTISDMTPEKKSNLQKYMGKKVSISINEQGRFGCQTSEISIEEFGDASN